MGEEDWLAMARMAQMGIAESDGMMAYRNSGMMGSLLFPNRRLMSWVHEGKLAAIWQSLF
jgi:hypothetical protein